MVEKVRVALRMRDVALALSAASSYSRTLSKIELQKLIYLIDATAHLYAALGPTEGHLTYRYGPYDVRIQTAADVLAFRGLVSIAEVRAMPNDRLAVRYQLTEAGRAWADRIGSDARVSISWQIAQAVVERVNALGWSRLVDLVYAEPTFVSARPLGYGQRLQPSDGGIVSASLITDIIDQCLSRADASTAIAANDMVHLLFRYLDNYDEAQKTRRSGRRVM
jgi:hypothetical protein